MLSIFFKKQVEKTISYIKNVSSNMKIVILLFTQLLFDSLLLSGYRIIVQDLLTVQRAEEKKRGSGTGVFL